MKLKLSYLILSLSQLAQAQRTVVVGVNEECDFRTFINGTAVVTSCELGLTCDKSQVDPNKTDQPGFCARLVGVGENCGGFTPVEAMARCKPGLTCFIPPQEGPVVVGDAQGVCVAITTSKVEPTQTTSTVEPTQTTSTVEPTQTTSTVSPTQTTSTVTSTTSTDCPTSSVVSPTDVYVGAASGITALGFAGMIALFL